MSRNPKSQWIQRRSLKPEPRPSWKASDTAYRVTASELRQFIERLERLEAEKKDLGDQMKEVFAEAKGRGYDTKLLALAAQRAG
ncbi:MAG: DUF2312 domain-containing protein [Rhodobacteraceae bacterium]|nr:DUF2312 domain-containing protein [Paracoccaceae bacterium]